MADIQRPAAAYSCNLAHAVAMTDDELGALTAVWTQDRIKSTQIVAVLIAGASVSSFGRAMHVQAAMKTTSQDDQIEVGRCRAHHNANIVARIGHEIGRMLTP